MSLPSQVIDFQQEIPSSNPVAPTTFLFPIFRSETASLQAQRARGGATRSCQQLRVFQRRLSQNVRNIPASSSRSSRRLSGSRLFRSSLSLAFNQEYPGRDRDQISFPPGRSPPSQDLPLTAVGGFDVFEPNKNKHKQMFLSSPVIPRPPRSPAPSGGILWRPIP